VIRGRRVELRPVEDDDAPLIHRWQNDPEVWWSMDVDRPFSLADVRDDVARSRREGYPSIVTVDGRPVGRIGLNRLQARNRACSLSPFMGEPDLWDSGHARDALMTMLTYAFDRLDLHLVHVRTLAANDRLIEVSERCGFVREAQLRDRSWKDGRWFDHVEMSVTREEFGGARESWEKEAKQRA
jgi:RimJ/RimL family protein N-acetyltransferase